MCSAIILFLFVISSVVAHDVIVNTKSGRVKGAVEHSFNGTKYFAFHTIRYAKAPVGALRFQAPVPPDPWTDVYDATTANGAICYQVSFDLTNETEDCLFLSVYSPNPWKKEKYPVVFHIHGGGFYFGWADIYGPGYFMDSARVVVVNINYRLGPFGFLSTQDGVFPGNMGLKDQLLALKWVHENIAAFGGDPDRVTLMGESSGATSVDYHILSPRSAGLFRAAVLLSGTAISSWASKVDRSDVTFDTAKLLNSSDFYNVKDTRQLLSKLQRADAREIDAASKAYKDGFDQNRIVKLAELQVTYYAAVVEKHNNQPFITERPYESFLKGHYNKVPIFLGMVDEEGLIVMIDDYLWMLDEFDKNNSLLVTETFHIKDRRKLRRVGTLIKQEYSPDTSFQQNHVGSVKFYTDQCFQKSILKRAFIDAPRVPVYLYLFTYEGQKESFHVTIPGADNVMHSEDFGYPWEFDNSVNFTKQDKLVKDRMIRILTNFATFLDPTPKEDPLLQYVRWPTIKNDSNYPYLEIGTDLSIKKNYKQDKFKFWDNLFHNYGEGPFEVF
ncbi:juvenile hormone esterase-like [Cylas formicarius]|uniref:juvenile hormone esterase-like n=1 Tax=Cylas formicarius TaxID=197179 RepID=UPI0029584E2E|nr:juvenile hormone esterase-like [Cylas formicarius]